MKRLLVASAVALVLAALGLAMAGGTASAGEDARVRVVHASPDAPNVDVYVDDTLALSDVPYKAESGYVPLPAGAHNFKVFAAGADPASDSPVIDADATLDPATDYTIVALGLLEDITAGVFVDDNAAPAEGKAHVRVIHASPDAPAVDVAVAGGPVLFSNLAFGEADGPTPVDAGTYDLEVRAAGTETVALPISGVTFAEGKIYTVLAVGLLEGEPALEALPIVNDPVSAPAPAPTQPAPAPTTAPGGVTVPNAGSGPADGGSMTWLLVAGVVLAAGAIAGTAGLAVARNR
jgi:hypothetical protein